MWFNPHQFRRELAAELGRLGVAGVFVGLVLWALAGLL
jgi:hypothetical protein